MSSKNEKFEFKFPYDETYGISLATIIPQIGKYWGITTDNLEHGRYRLTKQGADLSLKRNRRANRLEMLVEHLGGLEGVKGGELLWTIYYSYSEGKWAIAYYSANYEPEKVYMTEEVANKVVDMLNNGEYVL